MVTVIDNVKAYLRRGVFAQAVLIRGGFIAAAGSRADIDALAPAGARRIDGAGGLLLPGFHDSHLHLMHAGQRLREIQLSGVTSLEALIRTARSELERIAPLIPPDAPVHGAGWNQNEFTEGERRYPERRDLDRVSASRPLILARVCGHTISCNSAALKAAGAGRDFPDIPGGGAERGADGAPTGVFHGNAARFFDRILRPYTAAEEQEHIECALRDAAAAGITGAASNDVFGGNGERVIAAYRAALESGRARARVSLQCAFRAPGQLAAFRGRGWITGAALGHPLLTMGQIKLFADGSLGSRTAYLREPYADAPETRGFCDMSSGAMAERVREADSLGYQTAVHAIGDGAIEQAVSAIEAVTAPGANPRRHSIIHCEAAAPGLLARMAARGIPALVQPAFLTHDIAIAVPRLGERRAAFCHAFASMQRLGIPLAFGTDHPVEPLNPLGCIRCAVLRVPAGADGGAEPFFPAERLSVEDAVDAYTAGSAFAAFQEGKNGRIAPGYYADLTLLDRDIFARPPEETADARVVFTMTGGVFSYGP